MTAKRISVLPDIPTLEEAAISGVLSSTWNGVSAPRKTPKAFVDKINAGIAAVQRAPAVVEHFKKRTPAEGRAFVGEELRRGSEIARQAGVKPCQESAIGGQERPLQFWAHVLTSDTRTPDTC